MAAKTTIKLVPPLVFFIFPSIGIVTVLPAILTVFENLKHLVDSWQIESRAVQTERKAKNG